MVLVFYYIHSEYFSFGRRRIPWVVFFACQRFLALFPWVLVSLSWLYFTLFKFWLISFHLIPSCPLLGAYAPNILWTPLFDDSLSQFTFCRGDIPTGLPQRNLCPCWPPYLGPSGLSLRSRYIFVELFPFLLWTERNGSCIPTWTHIPRCVDVFFHMTGRSRIGACIIACSTASFTTSSRICVRCDVTWWLSLLLRKIIMIIQWHTSE